MFLTHRIVICIAFRAQQRIGSLAKLAPELGVILHFDPVVVQITPDKYELLCKVRPDRPTNWFPRVHSSAPSPQFSRSPCMHMYGHVFHGHTYPKFKRGHMHSQPTGHMHSQPWECMWPRLNIGYATTGHMHSQGANCRQLCPATASLQHLQGLTCRAPRTWLRRRHSVQHRQMKLLDTALTGLSRL